jgi:hypothetical protein
LKEIRMYAYLTRLLPLASAAFLYVSPLLAAEPDSAATTQTLAAWVQTVNARADRAMVAAPGADGLVIATFRRAEDGRVTDIRISGASLELREAARRTLSRIGRLPPLPQGVDPHQRVRAELLFGAGMDPETYRMKRRIMLAAADVENRRVAGGSAPVELASSDIR